MVETKDTWSDIIDGDKMSVDDLDNWLYENCESLRVMLLMDREVNKNNPDVLKETEARWLQLRKVVLLRNGVELDENDDVVGEVGEVDGSRELI